MSEAIENDRSMQEEMLNWNNSHNEQRCVVEKIYNLLNNGGHFIFETMTHTLDNLNAQTVNN
jgi:hypothetical protein